MGIILEKHGETFSVDVNGPCAATLPVLAFESATARALLTAAMRSSRRQPHCNKPSCMAVSQIGRA